MKGNVFRLSIAYHRFFVEEFNDPLSVYANNLLYKYFEAFGIAISPYVFLFVPLTFLNMLIVFRVAKECPGVWYHMAQIIGDIGELICLLMDISGGFYFFAPIFSWTNFCAEWAYDIFSAFENFFTLFGIFGLVLLTFDRFLCICYPEKYFNQDSKTKIYLLISVFVAILLTFFMFVSNILEAKNPILGYLIQSFVWFLWFLCLTFSISAIIFFSVKTAKAAKNYQPPAGASNFSQTAENMKNFHHLAVRVLILNFAATVFMYWIVITYFFNNFCYFVFEANLTFMNGFCDFYWLKFRFANQIICLSPVMLFFSSNTGLIFHCIFSRVYRNEVKKLFREIFCWFRCTKKTFVVPFHG